MTVPVIQPGGRIEGAAAGSPGAIARRGRGGWGDFLFVLPTWAFMLAVGLIPAIYALWMSFTSQSLIGGTGEFVGLQNYIRGVFTPRFFGSLSVTVIFVVLGLVIQFVVGYLLAVALHRQLRGFRIARTVLLVPMLLTPVVVGLIWNFMFNPDLGVIGALVKLFGPSVNFFADPVLAIGVIVLLDSWLYIPFVMLMTVAGLTGVPDEVREASAIDGANWWQATRYVILPILRPVITVTLIVRCVDIVRIFDTVYTTTQGGPGTSTSTVSLLSYATTFSFYEFGQGAAMSIALTLVMFPVYFLYIRMTRV